MGFRLVRWLLMMFIFTFPSSHSHRGLIVIGCDWFGGIEWVRMNGSCLLKDENELDNIFFLFCNDENKQGMKWNFNFIRFVFHFCSVRWLLAILAKRNQSSFFLDSDLRKRDFDQIGQNDRNLNRICKECFEFVLFSFFFLIWGLLKTRNVERDLKSACSQQLVKFEKERKKSVIFSHLSNWMKLPRDWIGWMVEIGCNQTNNDFNNDRTWFSSSPFSEREKCAFL